MSEEENADSQNNPFGYESAERRERQNVSEAEAERRKTVNDMMEPVMTLFRSQLSAMDEWWPERRELHDLLEKMHDLLDSEESAETK